MLLLHHIDAMWLSFPTGISEISEISEKKANDEFKFAILVIQLACVEIRLMLDELAEQHEKQPDRRHEIILPACYTILEKSIEYLSQTGETSIGLVEINLDPELLLRLKGTMNETFCFIIEYLMDIKVRIKQHFIE